MRPCAQAGDARANAAAALASLPAVNAAAYGTEASVVLAVGGRQSRSVVLRPRGRPWDSLARYLGAHRGEFALGYLGFGLNAAEAPGIAAAPYPAAWFFSPEVVVEIGRRGWKALAGDARRLAPILEDAFASPIEPRRSVSAADFDRGSPRPFCRAVEEALRWIDGDATRRVTVARNVRMPAAIDMPASLASRPPGTPISRSFYLRSRGLEMVGHSPELLAEGDKTAFKTFKLSGTYWRSRDAAVDAALRRAFLEDAKIRHEHASSMQSTMTALAAVGTARRLRTSVLDLPGLRHLMTTLETAPRAGGTIADCLRAAFPSGARPKAEGLACIGRVEREGRGAYYGLVGLVRPDGSFSFSQVLRTVFRYGGSTTAWAGAAITCGSRPGDEHRETRLKLADIRACAGSSRR